MIPCNPARVGTLVIHNGEPTRVHDMVHNPPGNSR
jgi:translation elongation factor P/translation initiation factor 5A